MKIQFVKKSPIFQYKTQSARFDFFEYEVLLPKKQKAKFLVREAEPFVLIVPVLKKNTLLMIRQYRLGKGDFCLEFPGGSVLGKTPLEMAKEELHQETGYYANGWQLLGEFYLTPAYSNQKGYVFLAFDLIKDSPNPEPYEFIEILSIKTERIEKLIEKGKINDSPTITAYYYYKIFSGKLR